ncbi:HCNGP-like protein-domain-containing protein [Jimgerdemannia flammicorona]|uniref:HCNGP-like protein-domain-containing protein n=1 Tax=Jimgerdemannia flammicorona TaxID=994334 RepID=A0A433D9A4_9FUNG|nr:HCNGP-like protein-domain-containing protein [Jimgerdemannia flammicorona]
MAGKNPLTGLVSYDDDDDDDDDEPNQKVTGLAGLLSYGGDDDEDEDEEMENGEASQPLTKAIIHKVAECVREIAHSHTMHPRSRSLQIPIPSLPTSPNPSTIHSHSSSRPPPDTTPRKPTPPTHLRPSTSLTNSPSLANLVRLRTAHAASAPTSPNARTGSPLIVPRDRDVMSSPLRPMSPMAGDSPRVSDDGIEVEREPRDEDEEKTRKRMRELLRPKPIEGVEDWGLPPEPEGECDPEVEAKVAQFHALRATGTQFNTHLLRSKAFRNPHIYAKLVEFVDLDEVGSNFPQDTFDPHGFPPQAFATELVDAQRRAAEDRAQAQMSGARGGIQFVAGAAESTSQRTGGQFRKDAREIVMGIGGRGGAVPSTPASIAGTAVTAPAAASAKKRSSKWDVPAQGGGPAAGSASGREKERESKRRKE